MRAVKSYNKIPRPFFDFWACFGAFWLALLAALQCGAVGGLVRDIGPFLRALNLPSEGFADLGLVGSMLASAALSAPVSAAFAAYSYMSFHNGVWMGERPSADRSYGSSRLESRPFALRRVFEECDEDGSVPGLVVGSVGSDGGSVLVDDIGHAIVLGGTGSGKTTGCLLQTIVNLVRSEASFVSLDPKGELFDVTAAYAKESGYRLVCIDFSDPARSDGWLPLQEAVDCAKARRGRTRAELAHEVRMLSSVLVPDSRDSSPIWAKAARILFCGVAAYVAESPDVPDDARNLSTVAAVAAMGQDRLQRIVESLPAGSPARLALSQVAYAPEETYGGFRVNLAAELEVYADPSVSPMLARSDFSIDEFLDGKVALYVRFDSSTSAYDPLVAAFVSQSMDGLRRLAQCNGGELGRPVYWLLEEFPQLPKIPGLQKAVSIVRSAGMHLVFCCQDRSQVEAVYKEDAPAIFNNLGTTLLLSASDLRTCKHYSELLGSYTVESKSRSRSKSAGGGGTSESRSLHEARLFRPEDLQKWGYGVGHLVVKGGRAYACGALPVSKTWAGDALGLNGEEPGAAKRAGMAPCRGAKNLKPARVWCLDEDLVDEARLAASIDEMADPRFL